MCACVYEKYDVKPGEEVGGGEQNASQSCVPKMQPGVGLWGRFGHS